MTNPNNPHNIPLQALGIDLFYPDKIGGLVLEQPIDVLVITRVYEKDGSPGYRLLCNEQMDTVLGMGMINFAKIMLEGPFRAIFESARDDDE